METSPPKYLHIKNGLQCLLDNGRTGDRVPSENELARQYGVSRMTARRALNELLRDGRVKRVAGKGTFIAGRQVVHAFFHVHAFAENARHAGAEARSQVITAAVERLPVHLRGILPGKTAVCLHRVHSLDGHPVCCEIRYLRQDRCETILKEDLAAGSVHQLITETLGLPITKVWQRLEAVSLTASIARRLETPAGTPAFCMKQLIYSAEDPVTYVDYYLRSDCYAFEDIFVPGGAPAAEGWSGSGRFAPKPQS